MVELHLGIVHTVNDEVNLLLDTVWPSEKNCKEKRKEEEEDASRCRPCTKTDLSGSGYPGIDLNLSRHDTLREL